MTHFNIEQITDQPDRIYVEVEHRFNVVIERTKTRLALHVYPRTAGELWDSPFATFEVDESEIFALEEEIGEPAMNRLTGQHQLCMIVEKQPRAGGSMLSNTKYASTLQGLCDQLDAFCNRHRLPKMSADELLCELYAEEPRREELCQWLRSFLDAWEEAYDAEQVATANRQDHSQ